MDNCFLFDLLLEKSDYSRLDKPCTFALQAKKMNVKSLVSNQDKERSVELRIAKVAFTIFFLFLLAWTPYATVALIGAFGNR